MLRTKNNLKLDQNLLVCVKKKIWLKVSCISLNITLNMINKW